MRVPAPDGLRAHPRVAGAIVSAVTAAKCVACAAFQIRNDDAPVTEVNCRAGGNIQTRNALRRFGYAALHPKTTVCAKCERPLRDGEPVYLGGLVRSGVGIFGPFTRRWQAYICTDCRGDPKPETAPWPRYVPDREEVRRCHQCGRPCHRRSREWRSGPRARIFCSDLCSAAYYRAPGMKAAAAARHKVCATCGQNFGATRRDAATCSPACRQKAHRQRQRAAL